MSSPKRSSPKKRNPQDSTRRNVRASVKRDSKLTTRLLKAEAVIDELLGLYQTLDYKVAFLLGIVQRDVRPQSFDSAQRQMGYRHSTSAPHQIRVK